MLIQPTMHMLEMYSRAVCRIVGFDGAGNEISFGTGFQYVFDLGGGFEAHAVVTNKHVVRGCARYGVEFPSVGQGSSRDLKQRFNIYFPDGAPTIVMHPDAQIDLAVLMLNGAIDQAKKAGHSPYIAVIEKSAVFDFANDFDSVCAENVAMIGCPNGLWDDVNMVPLIRYGVTATPIYVDHRGQPEFMVDIGCYPGSSGSPIILVRHGLRFFRDGRAAMMTTAQFKLLGILYAGPTYTNTGKVEVKPIPTSLEGTFKVGGMMHLGYCIKASALDLFIPELQRLARSAGLMR